MIILPNLDLLINKSSESS